MFLNEMKLDLSITLPDRPSAQREYSKIKGTLCIFNRLFIWSCIFLFVCVIGLFILFKIKMNMDGSIWEGQGKGNNMIKI